MILRNDFTIRRMTTMRTTALAAALLAASTLPALAHEFWFEPLDYRIEPGSRIEAAALNGENFGGIEYAYSNKGYARSGIIAGDTKVALTGRQGSKPAVSMIAPGEGLNVVYHASAVSTLNYVDLAKFESFLKGKHLEAALEQHAELGFPTENIKEAYFRYAKTLVAVGNGAGSDEYVGMPYELVALDNPYTSAGDIRFSVLLEGKPAAGVPVFVFRKQAGKVEKIDLTSDSAGQVTVPRKTGGEFMVNAVHITTAKGRLKEVTKAQWVTLWASLTYEIGD